MKLRVSWVKAGRGRSGAIEALAEDYAGRLRQYTPLELQEYRSEDALLEAARKSRGKLVLLERTGKKLTSREIAEFLRDQRDRVAPPLLTFAVGPADGFSEAALHAAGLVLSFGAITLPHDLARVVL